MENISKRRKRDHPKKRNDGKQDSIEPIEHTGDPDTPSLFRIRPPPLLPSDINSIPHGPLLHVVRDETESTPPTAIATPTRGTPAPATPPISAAISPLTLPPLYHSDDNPQNKRGFRYVQCMAAPGLPSLLYTTTEVEPFSARVSYEDRSSHVNISKNCDVISTDKGFRSARANVCIREGEWYYEIKILRGNEPGNDAHVRPGIVRREASLETPVGMDAYGYGFRDVTGQKVHVSRPTTFMDEGFATGDVISFHISLPKIHEAPDVVRDRIPIRYKGQLYFECFEYVATKPMEQLVTPGNTYRRASQAQILKRYQPPTLPGSFIKVYKNGLYMGTAFEDLYDFMPPHSKFQSQFGARDADDGMLGYYPTVSVFRGGMAQFNFGPEFFALPEEIQSGFDNKTIKPLCLRYDEQIAEDVVYDLVDELDFEVQDEEEKRERMKEREIERERERKQNEQQQQQLSLLEAQNAQVTSNHEHLDKELTAVTVKKETGREENELSHTLDGDKPAI